jgi:hypothetical protein
MAQRYAFCSDHSMYLHSSPLICAADTMLTLLRILITSITLHTSPLKSTRIIYLLYNDSYFTGKEEQDHHLSSSSRHETSQTWPRWMLFIMGTLPAAIKLGSFTGLPWSKTWGMMFLSSFVINEIIALSSAMGHDEKSIPEILGSESVDWHHIRQDDLRDRMFRLFHLDKTLLSLEKCTKDTTRLLHLILLIRAGQKLWEITNVCLLNSEIAQHIITVLSSVTTILTCIGLILDIYFHYQGLSKWMANSHTNQTLISRTLTPLLWIVQLLPKPSLWEVGETGMRNWAYITVIMYYFYARGYVFQTFIWFCSRFPRMANSLMIEKSIVRGEQHGEQKGSIDAKAFNCLFFFLVNLLASLLWYAYKYNPEGTENPDWTDIFG